MDIEHNLERALRREHPPAGFAARVLARLEREAAPDIVTTRAPWWRAVAAGVLLTMVGGGFVAHREIERRRGEHARAQVLLALRITGQKMHEAREHVREIANR
jgi:hypothetical protein